MRLKINCVLVLSLFLNFAFSQNNETLLTIDGEAVSTTDFLKLYTKNIDLVKDESQKEIDNYLELFINYKLKLKEAYRLGLDKDAKYKREFENYKKQLSKNYLSDNKVTDALVEEAYQRMRFDIKASHILILSNPEEEDTLVAYNKLLNYRTVLLNEGFETAKKKYHNGKTTLVEDLGYFSAFKMVYEFETVAYNTEPGTVSRPFKTQFGYHIIRVDNKRLSRGTATAAHIMVALNQKDSTINPENRINEIYKKLQQGDTFEALAKQFSDDKSSAKNGGTLRAFKSGQLSSTAFENATFAIANKGDITPPVKTEFGWHIIKLIEKVPLQDFESLKPTLEAQVKRDARSKLINSAMVNELSRRYKIIKNPETESYFKKLVKDDFFNSNSYLPKDFDGKVSVITVNDSVYTNNDFVQYLKSKQRQYMRQQTPIKNNIDAELNLFYEQSILNFREINLVNENDEFADVLAEYRDGLLLFELMESEIWNKASKDSIGLQTYYSANSSKYVWEDRVDVLMASSSTKKIAEKVEELLKAGKNKDEIKRDLNSKDVQNIIFTTGIFELSNVKLPPDLEAKKGISKVYNHNGGYHVFKVNDVLQSQTKTLQEARGMVVSDYQTIIETNWLVTLKDRFKVIVNNDVLNKIKSQIQN